MILVFGGTTEGRRVAGLLNGLGVQFYYSTKTPGKPLKYECAIERIGALDTSELSVFCRQHHLKLIVDAAHPFASALRQTIQEVSQALGLPVIHFERDFSHTQSISRASAPFVQKVQGFEEAISCLITLNPNLVLATTGVQSIPKLKPYWQEHAMLIRILPQPRSVDLARAAGFPPEQTLTHWPNGNTEDELKLIQKHGVDCLLSKESGASGFMAQKIQAAKQCQIPLVIIERPPVPESFHIVRNNHKFTDLFHKLYP
jgi:precorrin-6x reductase